MAELLLLLFALLALGSPSVSICFVLVAIGASVWRQSNLRKELAQFREESSKQNDALHRELIDLKRQLAASTRPTGERARDTSAPALETQTHVATVPSRAEDPSSTAVKEPTRVQTGAVPPQSKPISPTIAAHSTEPSKDTTGTVAEMPAHQISDAPTTQRPVSAAPTPTFAPAQRASDAEVEKKVAPIAPASPTVPPTPAGIPFVQKPATDSPLPVQPEATPPSPTHPARIRTPQSVPPPPTEATAPHEDRPTLHQRLRDVSLLEETLGTNWLNKLGVIMLVLGIALLGIYELGELGPLGKVMLSCVVSGVLLGGGIYLEKNEHYRILGRTGVGGGWALLFFTAYAVNHVHAMQILSSATADSILMLAVAAGMTAHTLRYNSQVVTGLAFLLGYSTVALSHDNVYSLTAGVILALGLVSIVIKRGWFELEFFGILSSYLNHLYWLYRLLGPDGAQGHAFPEYHASTTILFFYWATFRISYVIRKVGSPTSEHISTSSALANTILLLLAMKFQSVRPELAYIALFVVGAVEFVCGQLPIIKKRREAFVVLTVLGTALMIAAAPFHYAGNSVVILWMVAAESLLVAGCAVDEVVFRRLGLLAGLLAGVHLVGIEFVRLVDLRKASEALALSSGVVFSLCAVVFYLNALWISQKWADFFDDVPGGLLVTVHSYLGGFSAVAAAWALCSADWTAVAFSAVMVAIAALTRRLPSKHLQVQYGIVGLFALLRVFRVNLHIGAPEHVHIGSRLITLPLLAAVFYVTAWLAQVRDEADQRTFRAFLAVSGTGLVTALIYFEVPLLWQPLAVIMFATLLAESSIRLRYRALGWHVHGLTVLAAVAGWNASQSDVSRLYGIPLYAMAALPVVAGSYWLAKRIRTVDPDLAETGAIAYSWLATALMTWILHEALRGPWVAVGWILFAIALVITGRRIQFKHLGWQGTAVAFAAFGITFLNNFPAQEQFVHGISLRLVTVTLVAAGLYAISRKASAPDSEHLILSALAHTSAATGLLAYLAWYETPNVWLAAVWACFALILALVDRRFDLHDLGWQAHALAALAVVRSMSVNLYAVDKWHGISVRLLSFAFVACVLYTLARTSRIPDEWRKQDFHHTYSWVASVIVSLVLWYELQPISVALGWAIFGLVLFEYGLVRGINQLRYQAYVAFGSSFARIFFANLTFDSTGLFWGPRTYTILPLALIYFFTYAQIAAADSATNADRRFRVDTLLACLGTTAIVALLYFQLPMDWVVTSWAIVVFTLLGVAQFTGRRLFLIQGLLLSLAILVRGIVHNLFGASYFIAGDWTGRYFVLGTGIAILYATLPFAFRLRQRGQAARGSWRGVLLSAFRRPEQVLFFAATILLTLMLTLQMRAGMVTVAWGVEGVLIILLALIAGERSFRLTGLCLLLACVAKIAARDAWGLAPRDRYITFIILGMALLLVSFLYTKYRDAIRQLL